jgi:hypothetical protein
VGPHAAGTAARSLSSIGASATQMLMVALGSPTFGRMGFGMTRAHVKDMEGRGGPEPGFSTALDASDGSMFVGLESYDVQRQLASLERRDSAKQAYPYISPFASCACS